MFEPDSDWSNKAGKGFNFDINDVSCIEHITAIFIAVSNRNTENLKTLINSTIIANSSDLACHVQHVKKALEHAVGYAEKQGFVEISQLIKGCTIKARDNLSVRLMTALVAEYDTEPYNTRRMTI